MFQKPKTAKKLYFDVIPKAVDEYYTFLDAYPRQDWRGAARQSGLAHAQRQPAGHRPAGAVRAAAQPGQRLERAEQGGAVGLHLALRPGRDAGDPSRARSARRLRDPLLRGFREADQDLSARPTRWSAQALAQALGRAGALCRPDADGEAIQNAALNVARKIERYQDHAKQKPGGRAWRLASRSSR